MAESRRSSRWIAFCCVFLAVLFIPGCASEAIQRITLDFNNDWLFMKGELDEQVTQPDFDDSGWQSVRLPHDWAIAGPFDPDGDGSTGKLPWKGVGWYRKTFTLDAKHADRRVYLDFDAVMAFPKVHVNGWLAGEWDYGYNSFRIDATPYVIFGEENVIAVVADTRRHRSRWYPGAGIYRKVTMTVASPVHIAQWGTFVTTPSVSDDAATIKIAVTVENHLNKDLSADVAINLMESDAFVAGEFVWTGFDYLGEPSPFVREARSSYFGIVDLCGIPKDRYYLYRSYWRPDETTVHILPHWNWPNREGKTVPVFVYTNGDSAELFLNGRSLGRRTKLDTVAGGLDGEYFTVVDRYRLRWMDAVYEPGELRAVAYRNGAIVGEAVMKTAGDPAKLVLTPDCTEITADGSDLSYVLVEAVDREGNSCPLADDLVTFEVDGPAEIAGIGNGNPLSMESFQSPQRSLFHGKAMLILRSLDGESGTVRVTAETDGYESAQIQISTRILMGK